MFYSQIIKEMENFCADIDQEYPYTIMQTRAKFKNCFSTCIAAALTITTASGIKRFQDDKSLGN